MVVGSSPTGRTIFEKMYNPSMSKITAEKIAARAYQIYLEKGRQSDAAKNWLQAEAELKAIKVEDVIGVVGEVGEVGATEVVQESLDQQPKQPKRPKRRGWRAWFGTD